MTAAFVHCKAKHLVWLHHPIISYLYGDGVVAECSWIGTRDYNALVAVPEAIQFVKDVAGSVEEYSKENHYKVVAMAEMLASAWGTFLGTPPEMCAAMAMIALPPPLNVHLQVIIFPLLFSFLFSIFFLFSLKIESCSAHTSLSGFDVHFV